MPFCVLKQTVLGRETVHFARWNGPFGKPKWYVWKWCKDIFLCGGSAAMCVKSPDGYIVVTKTHTGLSFIGKWPMCAIINEKSVWELCPTVVIRLHPKGWNSSRCHSHSPIRRSCSAWQRLHQHRLLPNHFHVWSISITKITYDDDFHTWLYIYLFFHCFTFWCLVLKIILFLWF